MRVICEGKVRIMGKHSILAVGGGGLSALAALAFATGSPVGVLAMFFAPLPLMLVGLALGSKNIALAVIVGAAASLLATGSLLAVGYFISIHALPSWLVIHQAFLRRMSQADSHNGGWYPIGSIAASLAAVTTFVALSSALSMSGGNGIEANIHDTILEALDIAPPIFAADQQEMLAEYSASMLFGLFALYWQFMIILNALVAQSLLARQNQSIRPTPQWSNLDFPEWLSWLLVVAAILALAGTGDIEYLGRNAVIALSVPFFFAGLAAIHLLMQRLQWSGALLVLFYALLILFFGFVATAVAGLGMLTQWSQWRPNPLPTKPKNQE